MLIIGSHVSFNKDTGIKGSFEEALSYGANTFMFYTGAPQNTIRYPINKALSNEVANLMTENGISIENIVVHAPYIVNLANRTDENKYSFSVAFLKEEVNRCKELGIKYLVIHPGNHVGAGIDTAIINIIAALNTILNNTEETIILLETMSGKGSEVGSNFEELKTIIDGTINKERIGICLDTCHLNDAGYDVSDFDTILDKLDKLALLKYVKCVHINDSKNVLGSKLDRHENIGYGTIGYDKLLKIIYNQRLLTIPKILETPWIDNKPPYKEEIDMIRNKKFKANFKSKI